MVSTRVLQLLMLACLAPALPSRGENESHLVITPRSPVLEIGTNFTATCMIVNTAETTADDLYWKLSGTIIPKEKYTKINGSAFNVTILITSEEPEWLFCRSDYDYSTQARFIDGILLTTGYHPEKPENLSCNAVQEGLSISSTISCSWEPVGRQTKLVPTTYTLHVKVSPNQVYNVTTNKTSAQVAMGEIFPHHMTLDISVEACNKLGTVESGHLIEDAGWFVKTNPPSDVKVISEKSSPTSLLINWTPAIARDYLRLINQIRFCRRGCQSWTYVPLVDTVTAIQSFTLQNLLPDTVYVIQVRCKNAREGHGYWSNWSTSATKRTPEDKKLA